MAQSLANVLLHVVWSTKNREPWINDRYVQNQKEHHRGTRRLTFQDELRALLSKNGVACDERYIWE
jgi:hypothetical protein